MKAGVKYTEKGFAKARGRDSLQAAGKLTEVVDGSAAHRRPAAAGHAPSTGSSTSRCDELPPCSKPVPERPSKTTAASLLERYEWSTPARKVVGVGSVGTRCFIILLLVATATTLFLQVKEAGPVGARALSGQQVHPPRPPRRRRPRLTQAASDIFLGWMTGQPGKRHFYWRQLRDMKGSIETEQLKGPGLEILATMCGWTLARGHSRSGHRIAIASYLGVSDRFDQGIADFAVSYADQAEKDYETVLKAIKRGKIAVETGI